MFSMSVRFEQRRYGSGMAPNWFNHFHFLLRRYVHSFRTLLVTSTSDSELGL